MSEIIKSEGKTKLQKLQDYLGDFKEYDETGWIYVSDKGVWEEKWKNQIYVFESLGKLPEVLTHCHCSTKIIRNCLIIHNPTGRLEFVGSECIKYFKRNGRRCIDCHNPNRCPTKRCKDCRRFCPVHKEYHDDNTIHETICSFHRLYHDDIPILTFGKYEGRCIDSLVGVDDSYIQWLLNGETESPILEYTMSILPKTKISFGKYKNETVESVKKRDLQYYNWFKSNINKPFCQYL